MKDESKTKSQLIYELQQLRSHLATHQSYEQRSQTLLESLKAVLWTNTPGITEQIYVSPSYEAVWGRPLEEAYATPPAFTDSIHPEDRESYA